MNCFSYVISKQVVKFKNLGVDIENIVSAEH